MQQEQFVLANDQHSFKHKLGNKAQIVLICGTRTGLAKLSRYDELRQAYPKANLVYISTTGNIHGVNLTAEALVITAIYFEHSAVVASTVACRQLINSAEIGKDLIGQLPVEGLRHVLVFSDGIDINPTGLLKGINSVLPGHVLVTGGIAGDDWEFSHTLVGLNEVPKGGCSIALGLYGERLNIGYGVGGGWDSFGPDRIVTHAEGNILYELDGKPALELYKRYLGKYSEELPRIAMFFPMGIRTDDGHNNVVRSVLNVDEKQQALILAGDVSTGDRLRLMKSSNERLLDGASAAATQCKQVAKQNASNMLALVVSCVGRQEVLGQRIEEELEEVQQVLGNNTLLTGFYSYGEYAPFDEQAVLHNQTITITVLSENEY